MRLALAVVIAVLLLAGVLTGVAHADGNPGPIEPAAPPVVATPVSAPVAQTFILALGPIDCPAAVDGTGPRDNPAMSQAPILAVRAGQNGCFDRLVFDIAGPIPPGYHVEYVKTVFSEGQGAPLNVPGGARLQVVVRSPAFDDSGRSTLGPLPDVSGFAALRSVVFGGSFEGQTTFGVGVRARLPFRIFSLPGPGTHSRLVIDVAHQR